MRRQARQTIVFSLRLTGTTTSFLILRQDIVERMLNNIPTKMVLSGRLVGTARTNVCLENQTQNLTYDMRFIPPRMIILYFMEGRASPKFAKMII